VNKEYKILDWDSHHFGYKVAIISGQLLDVTEIDFLLDVMRQDGVRLAYFEKEHNDISSCVSHIAKSGKLVDKKTTYIKDISNTLDVHYRNNNVVVYEDDSTNAELDSLAIQSGVYSRFNLDENIDEPSFKNLYRTWMKKSVESDDIEILVVTLNHIVVGMITLYVEGDCGKIGLLSVDSQYRGYGIGKDLIHAAIERFKELKCETVEVITQQGNIPACSLYETMGFDVKHVCCFYHFWL